MIPICYVSSPLRAATPEEQEKNLDWAKFVCREVATRTGLMPIAPHLHFPLFLNDGDEVERGVGIEYCLSLVENAAACLFALPEWRGSFSAGMTAERGAAIEHNKLVWSGRGRYGVDEAIRELAASWPKHG